MSTAHACPRHGLALSGEFQHRRHRFVFPSPSAAEENRSSKETDEADEAETERDEGRRLDELRASGELHRKILQTPDSARDPDAWVVEWEKAHPYIKLKLSQQQEEEQHEVGQKKSEPARPDAQAHADEAKDKQEESKDKEGTKKEEEEEAEFKEKEKAKMKGVVVQEGRGKGLIRLTGQHPLNAEPPTGMLVEAGLITPSPLHYVRNHGPVPRLHWNTHRVHVCGMVERPHEFSMEELSELPTFEIPVTVVCDGNRRKELNTITRSKGFDWGAGAVGTAMWRGVSLASVIRRCGVQPGAKFVCFEGADQLNNGNYGTSIPLAAALEDNNDMMLALEMNRQPLPPDHGYPVRVVLPGYVGGRMVKWLSKIEITAEESTNWHHYYGTFVVNNATRSLM